MATVCEECGYRTNEVKPGGGIEKQGMKITVNISTPEDLNRDILKVFINFVIQFTIYIYFL